MNIFTPFSLASLSFIFLISACSSEKSASEYLETAQSFRASGDLRSALIESRNAIRLDSENVKSRALTGELELLAGKPSNSEKELLRAIDLGASAADLTHFLSKAYLLQGKHEELIALDVSNLSSNNAAEVLAHQANAHIFEDDLSNATDLAKQALERNPESSTAITVNARIQAINNNVPKAKELLATALQISETNAEAWELLGDIESTEQNYNAAVSSYTSSVDAASNKLPAILKRAQTNLRLKDFSAVKTDLDLIDNSGAKLPATSLMKSEIFFSEGKFLDAQSELENGMKLAPDSAVLARSLALTHLMLGNLGQAEQFAKKYQTTTDTDDALVLLATIRLQQDRSPQVENTLQPLIDANRLDIMGSRVLVTAYLKQGKSDEAITTMISMHEKLEQADVNTMPDLALLSPPSAVVSIELLKIDPTTENENAEAYLNAENLSLVTAVTHLASGRIPEAISEVQTLAALSPGHPAVHNMMGRIYIYNGDLNAARESFQKSYSSNDPFASSALYLALLDINDQDMDSARSRLKHSLEYAEGILREQVLLALTNIENTSGNTEKMVVWLQQAITENKDAYLPAITLANHFIRSDKPQEALDVISSLSSKGKSNPQSIKLMAQAHLAMQQFEEARNLLTSFVSLVPEDSEGLYLRAGAFAGLGNTTAVISDLEAAIKANPEHIPSLIAKTNIDIQTNSLDTAASQLAQLETLASGAPAITELNKRLNEHKRKNNKASSNTKPETTEEVMQAAKTLWNADKQNEALLVMTQWIDENPEDVTILLTLGNTYTMLDKEDKSIAMFGSVLDLDPDNFVAHNNLAWQLRERDPTTAISHASAALILNPDNIATLDTLAVIHYGQGNYKEAEKAFRKIQVQNPTNPSIVFHGARIEAALGNVQAAIELLEPIVSNNVEFPDAEAARALLEKL